MLRLSNTSRRWGAREGGGVLMCFQRILPTFQAGNLLITAVVELRVAAMIHDKLLRSVQLYHHQYKRINQNHQEEKKTNTN